MKKVKKAAGSRPNYPKGMTGMMLSQPQLLQIALDPIDVVYTPDWVARDMVEFFQPSGRILEPAAGDGAILKYLPSADWCEIEKGRDFYAYTTAVDWIVTNPPYSQYGIFLDHAMTLANDILFLAPCNKPFNGYEMMTRVLAWGGLKHMRNYGPGSRLDFPIGFAIGALHYQKDYHGPMEISFYQ
jgi:hypothetical protein